MGWGVVPWSTEMPHLSTPTPSPPHKGPTRGGEESAATSSLNLAPMLPTLPCARGTVGRGVRGLAAGDSWCEAAVNSTTEIRRTLSSRPLTGVSSKRSWPAKMAVRLTAMEGTHAKQSGVSHGVYRSRHGRPSWRDRDASARPASAGGAAPRADRPARYGDAEGPVRAVANGVQDLGQMGAARAGVQGHHEPHHPGEGRERHEAGTRRHRGVACAR